MLARSIAFQNQRLKRFDAAEASQFRLATAVVAGKVWPCEALLSWYRKRTPLAAGISNVNLNRSWVGQFFPDPIVDYLRVSPVGPMMPVVFTPSTLGEKLHFGLTCRSAIISPEKAKALANEFSESLIAMSRDLT